MTHIATQERRLNTTLEHGIYIPGALVTLHLLLRLDELRLPRLSPFRRWSALRSALVTMSELQIGEPERVAVLLQLPQTLGLFDG
ncbi:MAG: hypothetical protein OXN86_04720 [Chloroflexota bacterium]|nr:hypothetical protein [Chloroflexota bacterium]